MKRNFNKNNPRRYIRFDGSKWDSKGVFRYSSQLENKISAIGLLIVGGITVAQHVGLDANSIKMAFNIAGYSVGSFIVATMKKETFNNLEIFPNFSKPIDKYNHTLKPSDLTLDELETLDSVSQGDTVWGS